RSKRQHEGFSQAHSGRRMPQVASTGPPNWPDSFTSHAGRFFTGFVKEWPERANSMNPCTAGSCGLMERSRNGFLPIISARLGTSSATVGRMHPLPTNLDEDIIPANHERLSMSSRFRANLPGRRKFMGREEQQWLK